VSQPINGSSPTEGTGGSDPRVTIISTYDDAPDSLEGQLTEGYGFRFGGGFNGVQSYDPEFVNLSAFYGLKIASFDGVQSYDPEFVNLSNGYTII
jgi:hypothetical protein